MWWGRSFPDSLLQFCGMMPRYVSTFLCARAGEAAVLRKVRDEGAQVSSYCALECPVLQVGTCLLNKLFLWLGKSAVLMNS